VVVDSFLDISVSQQVLAVIEKGEVIRCYPVSTAKNGVGEQKGSECTPRGWHRIRAKIGSGLPLCTVFVGRRPTGEVFSSELSRQYPERDWILTRILWLTGLESGKNRYGNVDSGWRYIYIHGCPDHLMTGKPESHGCIRMLNTDIVDLFDHVTTCSKVYIHQ